jgi:hypothetical protein
VPEEAAVPNNITPITPGPYAHLWPGLDQETEFEEHRVYKKLEGKSTPVSVRLPNSMYREAEEILFAKSIPGIKTTTDLLVDALSLYYEHFHKLGVEGFYGFETSFALEVQRKQMEDNDNFIEQVEELVRRLSDTSDILGMEAAVSRLLTHKSKLTKEPKPFRDKLDGYILELQRLINAHTQID